MFSLKNYIVLLLCVRLDSHQPRSVRRAVKTTDNEDERAQCSSNFQISITTEVYPL